jgi:Glutathione S-transferase, N-terminal domain
MSGLTLVFGNKNYSSWSMRAWLLMRQYRIEFEEIQIPLRQPDSLERKLAYSPAGKAPILIDGDMRIWDGAGASFCSASSRRGRHVRSGRFALSNVRRRARSD